MNSILPLPAHAFSPAAVHVPETASGMGAIDFVQTAKDLVTGKTTQQQGSPTPTGLDGRPVTGVMNPPAPLARTPIAQPPQSTATTTKATTTTQTAPANTPASGQHHSNTAKTQQHAQQQASLRVGVASAAMLVLGIGSYYIMEKNTSYRGIKAGAVGVVSAVATLLLWNAADPIEQPASSKQ